jgi:hypothetical protein
MGYGGAVEDNYLGVVESAALACVRRSLVDYVTSCRNMSNAKHALYQMSYIPC